MIKLDYRHYYYVLSLDIPGIIPRKLDIHMTNNWDPGHMPSRILILGPSKILEAQHGDDRNHRNPCFFLPYWLVAREGEAQVM